MQAKISQEAQEVKPIPAGGSLESPTALTVRRYERNSQDQ